MNWKDFKTSIELYPSPPFNFEECLVFLRRSNREILHDYKEKALYKVIQVDNKPILCKMRSKNQHLQVDFLSGMPSKSLREKVALYVWEWFDLEQDLALFYKEVEDDPLLQPLIKKYKGLKLIGIPDLFEALVWAIIGQQINLSFAYTLKARFVKQFGESVSFAGEVYWLHPTYEKVAHLEVEELRKLQFTQRKAEYVIGVAKMMATGQLSKAGLMRRKAYEAQQKALMTIRGVGAWTADYVLMRCLRHPSAFPIADVGLHNAIKFQLGLERKPTLGEIHTIQSHWQGWQAYATFYLWRSLL
ncbi:DNA-3-methyladenine glycosylase II [Pullulanibacillus pueri]|uniref:DNA-3-methyladenine glycosylase II n=1 Tax=Pullulanibacillus pueri TaxID=1437324 RepID=A0A8J2ZZ27_9BACL|nr:DNA-3-methyladenine glycosylase [Pullulanibacillus pueri]MBM7683912.1 DNA-3-methyladenine glycosylase II [Pullulanibacillus pueri]GGH87797.1 DNA-3-methyladenine glycosylase [Pullulanibacillus pueri]